MSNQESDSKYQPLEDETHKIVIEIEEENRPKSLMWVLYSCTATVCFALGAYILGIISVGGASAKFINSLGYFTISLLILLTKNYKFIMARSRLFKQNPEERVTKGYFASLKDTCYYDEETRGYKWDCLVLSFICGLLNLAGEFSIIFCFQHALLSLMNQGILTSLFTLGAIIVLAGSVILLKEKVRFSEVRVCNSFLVLGHGAHHHRCHPHLYDQER
jgi:hypothetical protein